jgi:cytochrome c oxidase assembly protein subunit 15
LVLPMKRSTDNPWLSRFAVLTAVATLFLVGLGGVVTSKGVGMAVPDWPNTFGENMFFFPFSKWVGGVFYEHTHRLFASLVGLLTAGLSGWIWTRETHGVQRWVGLAMIVATLGLMGVRTQFMFIALAGVAVGVIGFSFTQMSRDARPIRWWAAIAFSTVLIQGVLGGLRVTAIKDELGIFHGMLAQMFFVLVCAIALVTSHWWPGLTRGEGDHRGLRRWFLFTTILIFFQLALGATMRHQHAGLAIPDFPLAYGRIWPAMDADSVAVYNQNRMEVQAYNPITGFQIGLQMAHRIVAVLVLFAVVLSVRQAGRRLGWKNPLARLSLVWLGLIAMQIALGATTVWSGKKVDVTTAHVAVGALSLVNGTLLTIVAFRCLTTARDQVASSVTRRASAADFAAAPSGVTRLR